MEALGVERPVLVGQSFGGMVAQRFAIRFPHLCSGVVLLSTAARIDLEETVSAFRIAGGERIAAAARAQFTTGDGRLREIFWTEALQFYTRRQNALKLTAAFRPEVSAWFFSDAGDARVYDHRDALGHVHVPALVIGGACDPVFSTRATLELAQSFPEGVAEVHILDECGHGPARDRPDLTLSLIEHFTRRVAQADMQA
jgi:pimeloyl-ACP methyl ester carboxylesterase